MVVHDRTNIRELTPEIVGEPVDLVVGDLSFISLALVLDPLLSVTRDDGALALMVKPQFEVGKDRVGKGGVVRDLALRAEAVTSIADLAAARGWGAVAVTVSPLPGPSGTWSSSCCCGGGPPRSAPTTSAPRWSARRRWGWRVRGWTRDDSQPRPPGPRARPHRPRRGA